MNFELLRAIKEAHTTQGAVVRKAKLQSETRLSRIIQGYSVARPDEIKKICKLFNKEPHELGFEVNNG